MTYRPIRVSDRIPALDQFRGVAVLAVFLYHCFGLSFHPTWINWVGMFRNWDVPKSFLALVPLCLGWAGVAIFFVVSGFCIRLAHIKSASAGWKAFAIRRFWRIYPPYFVALIGFAFFYRYTRLSFTGPHHGFFDWAQLGSHLLLVHNVDPRSFYGINGAFWSIAVEVQLYLLYPVLDWLVRRWGWSKVIGAIGVIEVSLRFAMTVAGEEAPTGQMATGLVPGWLAASPLAYWFSWSIGAWLADARSHGDRLPFARQSGWIWATLFVVSYFVRPLIAFSFLFAAMTSVVVLARILARQDSGEPGRNTGGNNSTQIGNALAAIGAVSYSMYLLHQPMLMAVAPAWQKIAPALAGQPKYLFLAMLGMGVLVIPASWLFYRWIEQPCIAIGRKLTNAHASGHLKQELTPQ